MATEALKAMGCFPVAVKRMFLTQKLPSEWDPPKNWKLQAFWVASAKNIHHGCNSVIKNQWEAQQTQQSHVSPQGWAGTPIYLVLKWNFTAWKRSRIPPTSLAVLIFQKYPPRLSAAARQRRSHSSALQVLWSSEIQPKTCKKILSLGAQNPPENRRWFCFFWDGLKAS